MCATSTGSAPQRTQSPPSRSVMFDLLVSDIALELSVAGISYVDVDWAILDSGINKTWMC